MRNVHVECTTVVTVTSSRRLATSPHDHNSWFLKDRTRRDGMRRFLVVDGMGLDFLSLWTGRDGTEPFIIVDGTRPGRNRTLFSRKTDGTGRPSCVGSLVP